jgi:hypothetical protein
MTRGVLLLVLLLAVALIGVSCWGANQVRRTRELAGAVQVLESQAQQAAALMDSLRRAAQTRDTVYRQKWLPRWDTVRTRETVTLNDTVYVPFAVADSTVMACTMALDACQRLGIQQDTVIARQRLVIQALERKPGPCRVIGMRCEVLTLVGGLVLGAVIRGGT